MLETNKVTRDELVGDFRTVIADAEALLKQTINHGGEELAEICSRAEASIVAMKARLADEQAALVSFTKDAGKNVDIYVHLYPWTAIGVAAGVGLLAGRLSCRR
jgi:ElaB/YqjD/DUF883 family membrane-anchored ribosome-binding protein